MLNNNGVARCVATENNNEPSCDSAPMTCDLQENCASITPSLCGAAWEDRCKTGVRNSEGEKACSLQQYGSVNQCEIWIAGTTRRATGCHPSAACRPGELSARASSRATARRNARSSSTRRSVLTAAGLSKSPPRATSSRSCNGC